ncbi:protein SRC2-like [Solanum pennellii]|uniref:Protein SRC2-like n=1 Tax=Solanum pennellii TaxID=28526 RepID=A0ABM1FZG1_SOLPN|nr:protein SRC2-like [Solanum pennellii]
MEYRTLDINVVSGKDLNKVNLITKMDVYVVVSISGADDDRSNQKTKTHVDHDGDNNPTWNFPIKFTIDDNPAVQNRLHLVFKLRCQRALGDKDIGQVDVPIKELLESSNTTKQFVSYQIRKPSGKPKGQLTFSYQFSDKITGSTVVDSKIENPVTAYPAANPTPMVGSTSVYPPLPPPQQGPSGLYPPPPIYASGGSGPAPPPPVAYPPPATAGYPPVAAGYGYPPAAAYPPPPLYGYPPQQGGHGYGYPQVQRPPKKNNNNMALGLGAGLLGGALGGMIIGDAISDVGGGFDGGFGDVGGFDF